MLYCYSYEFDCGATGILITFRISHLAGQRLRRLFHQLKMMMSGLPDHRRLNTLD